jgi:hypothetical protein
MHRLAPLCLVLALLGAAVTDSADASCSSPKCPDQLAVDDLRARIAVECDCDGAASPKDWARCVKQITKEAAADGTLPKACSKVVRRCEAKTTCGKQGAVVCCDTTRTGHPKAKVVSSASNCGGTVCAANPNAGDACRGDATCEPPPRQDPGREPWELVPTDRVAEECGLDPALLQIADQTMQTPYAVVRHGKLCHEYYPVGTAADDVNEIFSTTKTLGALVTGVAAYRTRDLTRTGRKTGAILDTDRVDHWLDEFSSPPCEPGQPCINPDAQLAHVLAMIGHNPDLSYGHRRYEYDLVGQVQINRLSDVINTAIDQDPAQFGEDVEEFTQRFLFEPMGMNEGNWSGGRPDKTFGFTWRATVREMARVGLLMLNDGMWHGERLVGADWIYKMTHAAFEDSNIAYGYLTWLATDGDNGISHCAPPAIHASYPHGLSESPNCNFVTRSCEQRYDVGVWYALGLGGQAIMGHRGLDLVIVAKNQAFDEAVTWNAIRPALVALDPAFQGDDAAFCAAYDASNYAPDLR